MKITDIKLAVARKKLLNFSEEAVAQGAQRKLGVILDDLHDDSLNAFVQLKRDLNLEEKDFAVVVCGKKEAKKHISEYPVISMQDLGWSGKLSEEASAFLETGYDVLISFTEAENKMADFLVSVSRSRLKVGRKSIDENGIFDLNISVGISEPGIFTTELKKYLKILNATIE